MVGLKKQNKTKQKKKTPKNKQTNKQQNHAAYAKISPKMVNPEI